MNEIFFFLFCVADIFLYQQDILKMQQETIKIKAINLINVDVVFCILKWYIS